MVRSNRVVESDARQEQPRALHHGRYSSLPSPYPPPQAGRGDLIIR